MYNLIRIIALLLIFSIMFSCDNKSKDLKENTYLSTDLPQIFAIKDSIKLDYPLDAFPKSIMDLAFTEHYIYVFGANNDYPLVKFGKSGEFIQKISHSGNAPGEIPFQITKITAIGEKLAVASIGLNRVTLFDNDNFVVDKIFDLDQDNVFIKDVQFYDEDHLLLHDNTKEQNILVVNSALDTIQRVYTLPSASKLTFLIFYNIWGLQKTEDGCISHLSYPENIIEFKLEEGKLKPIKDLTNIDFQSFQKVDSAITLENYREANLSPTELFESFSKILWVVELSDYFAGMYMSWGDIIKNSNNVKKREVKYMFFLVKNGKALLEVSIPKEVALKLIPHNGRLITYDFNKAGEEITLKLYDLTLDLEQLPLTQIH